MKQNKNIPEGYKDSPLGIIPDEWEIKRLGSITTKIGSGVTPRGGESVYKKEGRIFLRSQNIGWGTLLLNDVAYIDETTHQKQSSTEVQEGDILLNITGASIGRSAVADKRVDKGNVNQHVCIIRLRDNILPYYINAYILSYQGQRAIDSFQAGGNRQGLNFEQISTFYIPIPPLFEQKTIASVLSIWDKAIEKQTTLIEKLEVRKRGLIQQLLTGKKRLPGFEGKWKICKIKEIAQEISLKNRTHKKLIVLSCTKYEGLVPSLEYFGRQIFSNDISNYKIVPQYHFAYATNHIEEGSIGYQATYTEALISPMYTVFKIYEHIINNTFLYVLLKTPIYISEYKKRMEGSINRRGGLKWNEFSNISVKTPPIEEQIAIVNFIIAIDREIIFEKNKLQQLKNEKKGLMQVLLTGKKRVFF